MNMHLLANTHNVGSASLIDTRKTGAWGDLESSRRLSFSFTSSKALPHPAADPTCAPLTPRLQCFSSPSSGERVFVRSELEKCFDQSNDKLNEDFLELKAEGEEKCKGDAGELSMGGFANIKKCLKLSGGKLQGTRHARRVPLGERTFEYRNIVERLNCIDIPAFSIEGIKRTAKAFNKENEEFDKNCRNPLDSVNQKYGRENVASLKTKEVNSDVSRPNCVAKKNLKKLRRNHSLKRRYKLIFDSPKRPNIVRRHQRANCYRVMAHFFVSIVRIPHNKIDCTPAIHPTKPAGN